LNRIPINNEILLGVDYDYFDLVSTTEKTFKITTDQGLHLAKTVVMAIGAGNAPNIPAMIPKSNPPSVEGQCHAMTIKQFPDLSLQKKVQQGKATSVLVTGGGLTAAQIADNALRYGVSKVYLLMRSGLKVKPFDVSLDWVGKFKNLEHSTFWSADSEDGKHEYSPFSDRLSDSME
jgi:cation diffusion facilitator CzcD-associated flavoprotein CzcO